MPSRAPRLKKLSINVSQNNGNKIYKKRFLAGHFSRRNCCLAFFADFKKYKNSRVVCKMGDWTKIVCGFLGVFYPGRRHFGPLFILFSGKIQKSTGLIADG